MLHSIWDRLDVSTVIEIFHFLIFVFELLWPALKRAMQAKKPMSTKKGSKMRNRRQRRR